MRGGRDLGAKNIFRRINYERRQTFQMDLGGCQKDCGAKGIFLKSRPNEIGDFERLKLFKIGLSLLLKFHFHIIEPLHVSQPEVKTSACEGHSNLDLCDRFLLLFPSNQRS